MKTIRAKVLLAVFVFGMATGPGYLTYCGVFSGSSVGVFMVFERQLQSTEMSVEKSVLRG